ncbi:MAG: DUF6054 family protein, partial [Methanomassiliicoccaceae archaeon]|nr:DUF6054 family protein [Methanomassiliicoccaceae archaeon]
KYESRLQGDFDDFLRFLENGIMNGSISASFEEGSDFGKNGVRCAVRAYERYSMMGSSRVSLSFVLIGVDKELFITVISTGGSQAIFFKINTIGEKSFLQSAVDIIEEYKHCK